ncbi:MAG TPA: multifunctional CCA tRNA nucleotidyl transferase/2'3'-cyclic phosphodiesterase/2'nucleotidase/phosphatase [Gammaproteobacteria bacterium]|nr:multifunctional CCA tRNA nucleotidyl transferase/2'3'-cyclic phosphodiesterase/2'nucleotidase/phosphatase [Gammaproteobacteria bacterium]
MEVFLVGGAVRDRLLGLPVKERDWVVVGATPEQMLELGYRPVGKDFPVFLHPETGEEYALARSERKTAPGYHGFEVHADPDVSLEEDLKRRDLTINAIAETPDGRLIDPFHGEQDLRQGLLRHVSPAFVEDPVRILRVARLAARFAPYGFHVAHSTNALMRTMVDNGEVDHLVPERVWAELVKALATDSPATFFKVLHGCGALAVLFPEIEEEYAGEETPHRQRGLPPALAALQDSAARSADPRVRFAVLLRALGARRPREQRLARGEALCRRLRAPNDYSRLALDAIRLESAVTSDDPARLLELMETAGAFRHGDHWRRLLAVYRAAGLIDERRADSLQRAAAHAAGINAAALGDHGLRGPELGAAIRARRLQAVREALGDEEHGAH